MEMLTQQGRGILNRLLSEDASCVPVLSLLGHLHGRYLSDYTAAIGFYDRVLAIEPTIQGQGREAEIQEILHLLSVPESPPSWTISTGRAR